MLEQIKTLFPCEVQVTQEIIDKANIYDVWCCIGALTLKSILSEEQKKYFNGWGVTDGNFDTIETVLTGTDSKDSVTVYAVDGDDSVDMMYLKEPRIVTLTLEKPKNYKEY